MLRHHSAKALLELIVGLCILSFVVYAVSSDLFSTIHLPYLGNMFIVITKLITYHETMMYSHNLDIHIRFILISMRASAEQNNTGDAKIEGNQIEMFKTLNGHENIDPSLFFFSKIKTGEITRGMISR